MITVNKKKTHDKSAHKKSYLALVVVKYRQYSPASDIYRIYPCIMRTFFTTFEAEKLRCALYTEPFVS